MGTEDRPARWPVYGAGPGPAYGSGHGRGQNHGHDHRLRIGDAERDHAADALADHLAAGRISVEEHAERLDAIWTARTRADLEPIFADLPRPAISGPPPRPGGGRRRPRLPVLPVIAVLVLLSALTHLPFWILIFFLGCGVLGRRAHHGVRA